MKIVLDKVSSPSLLSFRKCIIDELIKINPKFDKDLSNLHKYIQYDKINDIRIKLFKKINSLNWELKLKNIIGKDLINILGPDILIQTKLNLSILMPKDKTSLLPMHSDTWSADTPFQINSWIPLTDTFNSNSMYLFDEKKTISILKKVSKSQIDKKKLLKNIKINNKDFINLKFGKILIFNPSLLHGNIINKTKSTRVSLNIRFKSLFSPEPTNNPDRRYGTYYKDFLISKNSNFALKMIRDKILK